MRRLDPGERFFPGDDTGRDEVGGDLDRGGRGPLGRASLEDEELAALDRELDVLDVAVVPLELLADPHELGVGLGHLRLHLRDLRRGPDAGHDVLALGIREVLPEQLVLARVRVAGEGDAGARIVTHVAEDHRDDIDGGAQVVGDLLVVAVIDGPLAEPAREDGLDGEIQLLVRVAREVPSGVIADDPLELVRQGAQRVGIEVGVGSGAMGGLGSVERMVKALALHVHDDPTEHLDEAPVRVPPESLIAGQGDQPMQGLLVQAKVEDRVHHPGHGEPGTGADGDKERIGGIAEALARQRLDLMDGSQDVVPETGGQLLTGREVVVAGLGRDGEAGWDREARVGHLREAGTLAAQEVTHRGVALGAPPTPGVDVALRGEMGAVRARGRGRGHSGVSSGSGGGRAGISASGPRLGRSITCGL